MFVGYAPLLKPMQKLDGVEKVFVADLKATVPARTE